MHVYSTINFLAAQVRVWTDKEAGCGCTTGLKIMNFSLSKDHRNKKVRTVYKSVKYVAKICVSMHRLIYSESLLLLYIAVMLI